MLRASIANGLPTILLTVLASSTSAQDIDQGEARITARSDVRMAVESGPGTSGQRLQALARVITDQMGAVRQCYATVAEERPQIQGELKIRVSVPQSGPVQISVGRNTVGDEELTRCITSALSRAEYGGVQSPASAFAAIEFANTAAEGVERTAERRAEEAVVEVSRTAEGRFRATGGTPTGELTFTVTGDDAATRDAVAAMQRALRGAIPSMLDCRRRASSRGQNPEGDVTLALTVRRDGRGQARAGESTVRNDNARRCLSRALAQARFAAGAAGAGSVVVRFALREGETIRAPARAR